MEPMPLPNQPCRPRKGGYLSAADVVTVRSVTEVGVGPVTVRVLEVPEAVHAGVYNPYGYDHLEFHGKSVWVRRARGRFVVLTNPDDMWQEALEERLAKRDLRVDAVYSAERHVVLAEPPQPASPQAVLHFFERHSVRPLPAAVAEANHHAYAEVAPVVQASGGFRYAACLAGTDDEPGSPADQALHDKAPGDFLLVPREAFLRARACPEVPTKTHVDTMTLCALMAQGLGQLVFWQQCAMYHQQHPRNEATKFEVLRQGALLDIFRTILSAGSLANRRPIAVEEDWGEELLWEEAVPWERWSTADWAASCA